MARAIIALKLAKAVPEAEGDYIGCDRGTLFLLERGLPVKAARGDFDSVNAEEKARILDACRTVVQLPVVKDDTDSEAAIRWCLAEGYDEIWLTGGTGGRIDHMVINLRLTEKYPGRVVLWDMQNTVRAYSPGTYRFVRQNRSYISFFTSDEAVITLEGMKYPLRQRRIRKDDLYTVSNEIEAEEGILTVHEGIVLVMESRDA